jgi:hypothetical protein
VSFLRISQLAPFLFLGLLRPLDADLDATLKWDQHVIEAKPAGNARVTEAWFTFTNPTEAPVEILEVKSDCDCLIAQLDKTLYYPGETGLLLATIDIKPGSTMSEKKIQVKIQSPDSEIETVYLTVRLSGNPDEE